MGLVDYGSDDSEVDDVTNPASQSKAAPAVSKPTFHKMVDKSNSHKIRVTLPGTGDSHAQQAGDDASEPEPKRIKLGGNGGSRGINAFLPAPKRPAVAASSSGQGGGITSRGKSIAPGISLKTGSEPAFSREALSMPPPSFEMEASKVGEERSGAVGKASDFGPGLAGGSSDEIKPQGKATRFMPLSVSRRPKPKLQKDRPTPRPAGKTAPTGVDEINTSDASQYSSAITATADLKPRPAISLFSTGSTNDDVAGQLENDGDSYDPLFSNTREEMPLQASRDSFGSSNTTSVASDVPSQGGSGVQSLDSIASDLNLSASERRQLFGRRGGGGGRRGEQGMASAISVVNFNTDAEYAANEEMRAAGELPEQSQRVVRTINAAGRNSLKSLVNVVNTQSDALEEHFAKGRRNKQEAGNKYGW